jgi:hypothetical protein
MRNDVALLTGVAIGAATMFLLEQDRGTRRRVLIRTGLGKDESKLIARVRTALGRVVSHPHAIEVSVLHEGCVCLAGPILSREADAALAAVARLRGVSTLEDNLERHDSPEGVPALQGGRFHTARAIGSVPSSWSPAKKLIVALTGTAVAAGVTYAVRGSASAPDIAA